MALPAQVNELWSVWREMVGHAAHPATVNLYGAAGEHREAVRELFLEGSAHKGTLRVVELGTEMPPEAEIHLVLLDPAFGPPSSQLSALRKLNPKSLVLVMVGIEDGAFEARRREVATSVGVRLDHVVGAKTVGALRGQLAKRLLALFEEQTVALARQFPFLREEAAAQEIAATSQQNAMIGLFPVPGADMPIMTANQVKMVMRLAAIHDQPMTYDRLKEVLAVIGGGVALRTAARQLAKFVPGPGWLVAGGLGFAGSLAMGRAAHEYFRRQDEAPRGTPGPDGRTVIDAEATVVERP
jgi:uncharacterized protein (DUF697 family)